MSYSPFKIYNASAGSGKTYTLTKEYLRILLSPQESHRQILAITFTNKAVNEMKDRILNSLLEFSKTKVIEQASPMFNELLKLLQINSIELQQRSKNALKNILHNYSYFDVSTIDKFTHRLIRTFAKDLKLPQNFEVVLDPTLLLDEAVARLINKVGIDKKLTKVLLDFALEKIEDDKSWDITLDLNKVGSLLTNETYAEKLQKLINTEIDDFLDLQSSLLKKIKHCKENLISNSSKALQIIEDNNLEHTDFKSSWFPKFLLKIKQGDLKIDFKAGWKQNFKNDSLYASKCDDSKKQILDNIHNKFIVLFNNIKSTTYECQLQSNIYKNIVPLTVLNTIQKEIKVIQTERDLLPIFEFNRIISKEIKNQPAPFIYERLGEKYKHFFIDEFQDTSEMQWQNLIPLIDNSLSSESGSLFIVGDAKQSIYRWRGGNAEQFLELDEVRTFVQSPKIKNLPKNYRSFDEVINFNNDFFSSASIYLNKPNYQTLYKEGNKQESNTKTGGLVQLEFLTENSLFSIEQQYGNAVLENIKEIIEKKYLYKDITILVRGNKQGALLANFLTQENIPVISSDSLLLKNSPKIEFLINLLQYLDQPEDKNTVFNILSFLSKDLNNRHSYIATHLNDLEAVLESDFGLKFSHLKQSSVFDGLEYAIKHFDLAPKPDAYINFFMDTVLEVEQKEGSGTPIFLSVWEKKKEKLSISAPATINAVQIMTIHKAKGLEFNIAIFPYADSKIYNEQDPKLWLPVSPENYNGLTEVLINKKQEIVNYNEKAAQLFAEDNDKLELDAYNVLYVALTRAVKALYIITKKETRSKTNNIPKNYTEMFAKYLHEKGMWQEDLSIYSFGELSINNGTASIELPEDIPYQYSNKDRSGFKILTTSGMLWGTERDDAITKGNILHHIMSQIETKEDIEKVLNKSIQSGIISIEEKEELETQISNIINHPNLSDYYTSMYHIKNEKDIITQTGNILRPDRVVIRENKATIIDYKSGKRNIKYKEQLYTYANALEEMGYFIENKIIVYSNNEITPEFI